MPTCVIDLAQYVQFPDRLTWSVYLSTDCSLSGWLRGTVVECWPTFPVLRWTCSWRVTTYVGKLPATGQPTSPT